jgi:predicted nucleotidyltransferase
MSSAERLAQIRPLLARAYGPRLHGLVLYGSEARGEAQPDSDIDVLVVLRGPVHLWRDLQTALHALYPLSLRWERPISPKPVDAQEYAEEDCPLYHTAREEGILL